MPRRGHAEAQRASRTRSPERVHVHLRMRVHLARPPVPVGICHEAGRGRGGRADGAGPSVHGLSRGFPPPCPCPAVRPFVSSTLKFKKG